uniref:Uncharacterized protein n=1 Tax=Proboscia inermis TaxID=420281 RepID=A0A7S0CHN1_9STRA|mmetsp:Transcript_48779/g.49135  ORF Transcript_48779/g.49135 Transcript_48779/m.49135 type:complete len:122 (+) Transcript_48779:230-595(+)|eukprot:CAMPEP_0171320830 /NCGR_PEP_ID=MMETSP0816-20121228/107483_1 /TAXON_ID=420281 /ORGANISM="Proboscia inermis, Strain CCAP1064/1" /LENGTH=121 /DNA_ID=CAMNT_0011818145 /DNA_START=152 /DNA_END=517 /DNA_ORIENTATION=+
MSSILSGPMNGVNKVTDDTKSLFQSQPKMMKRTDQHNEDLAHFETMLSTMNLGPAICDKIPKINLAPVNLLMEAQEEAKNETASESKEDDKASVYDIDSSPYEMSEKEKAAGKKVVLCCCC